MKVVWPSLFMILLIACSGPKAIFTPQVSDPKVPTTVAFDNQSEKADSFRWNFGDGYFSNDSLPEHRYFLSGRYSISLEAMKGSKSATSTQEIILTPPDDCLVYLQTTAGSLLIELYDATPRHRDNFLKLIDERFYDSLFFHRVIDGFMIQGGDPLSRNPGPNTHLGTGGPGYQIESEFRDTLFHFKGALAAARQPDVVNPEKKSSGSQFYIVQGRTYSPEQLQALSVRNGVYYPPSAVETYSQYGGTPQLDGEYTVFGRVLEGIDIIDKIASVETNRANRPLENIYIEKVFVIK